VTKPDRASDPSCGAKYINRLNKIKVLNIIRTTENLNKENLLGQYDDEEASKELS